LVTTSVLAAMSPTRRCPFVVAEVTMPMIAKQAASTMSSTLRRRARPMPHTDPSCFTTLMPQASLPTVPPTSPSRRTMFSSQTRAAVPYTPPNTLPRLSTRASLLFVWMHSWLVGGLSVQKWESPPVLMVWLELKKRLPATMATMTPARIESRM
jgi:hypothetical protein